MSLGTFKAPMASLEVKRNLITRLLVIRNTSADLNVILDTDNNVCEDNFNNDNVMEL